MRPAFLATISILAFVVVVAMMIPVVRRMSSRPREGFSVTYPSDKKLRGGWDRSNVLTAVMPDGRLR